MSGESNVKKLAAILDGRQIGDEVTKGIRSEARSAGLVIVFGGSDDLIEFRGAIHDERGCYAGDDYPPEASMFLVDPKGIVARSDASEGVGVAHIRRKYSSSITANWDADGYSWTYTTDIPHETFDIMEDGDKYCRGIVFDLASLQPVTASVKRLLRDPEAMDILNRLSFLGYSPEQVAATMIELDRREAASS